MTRENAHPHGFASPSFIDHHHERWHQKNYHVAVGVSFVDGDNDTIVRHSDKLAMACRSE